MSFASHVERKIIFLWGVLYVFCGVCSQPHGDYVVGILGIFGRYNLWLSRVWLSLNIYTQFSSGCRWCCASRYAHHARFHAYDATHAREVMTVIAGICFLLLALPLLAPHSIFGLSGRRESVSQYQLPVIAVPFAPVWCNPRVLWYVPCPDICMWVCMYVYIYNSYI